MINIEAKNLTKTYGKFTALSDLNLKIEGAKCVGFLGPNGAGKTTTLQIFTNLIRPSSGQALINGIDVRGDKKRALESVGALIETPEIYQSLTPREALSMTAEVTGVPVSERKKRIDEVISEVRMDEWIDKKVGKFSKGMKQRVCIASALINDPCILFLDEPTSGLDPRGMSEVREIIKSLKDQKKLIFMSSHLLGEVSDVCDEVAIIDHGKLLVYDKISAILSKFSHGENMVEVVLLRPVNDGVIKNINEIPGVIHVSTKDYLNIQIKFKGGLEMQEKVHSEIAKMNIGIISYKSLGSELEDVYLDLIKDTK